MDKRNLIIHALQDLIMQDKGISCSVEEIAKQAGIGKGSIYYYFKSKEEIFDALVDMNYSAIIERCELVLQDHANLHAIEKIALLLRTYYASCVEVSIDKFLHESQNAYIHQKSLVMIVKKLTPILSSIITDGIQETTFQCSHPMEFSEIILSELCFIFDYGLFEWSKAQLQTKLQALAEVLEKSLSAPHGSFAFLTKQANVFKISK